jgi:sulfate transport system ATP-binding protein
MNAGRVEQVGSPQQVWDHPASPFVYGFLGDVNLFHGRAHEGEVLIGAGGAPDALRIDAPGHEAARDAKAVAYVRPHEMDVQPWREGASGITALLTRAIVVGPIARLELTRNDSAEPEGHAVIEAQLPAQEFRDKGLTEGDRVVLAPRSARVFVEG